MCSVLLSVPIANCFCSARMQCPVFLWMLVAPHSDLKALVLLHRNPQLKRALLGVDDQSLDENGI